MYIEFPTNLKIIQMELMTKEVLVEFHHLCCVVRLERTQGLHDN